MHAGGSATFAERLAHVCVCVYYSYTVYQLCVRSTGEKKVNIHLHTQYLHMRPTPGFPPPPLFVLQSGSQCGQSWSRAELDTNSAGQRH